MDGGLTHYFAFGWLRGEAIEDVAVPLLLRCSFSLAHFTFTHTLQNQK
jgi:hypothetical protein